MRNLTAKKTDAKLDPEDIIILSQLQVQGNFWKKTGVTRIGPKKFALEVPEAADAFRGFFIEVAFAGPDSMGRFEFTTEINIIPDYDPFPDCSGSECASWGMV